MTLGRRQNAGRRAEEAGREEPGGAGRGETYSLIVTQYPVEEHGDAVDTREISGTTFR